MLALRLGSLCVICGVGSAGPDRAPSAQSSDVKTFGRRDALAADRPVPRRPDQGDHRRARRAERLLHGAGQRRRVEDDRLRPHLDADLRRSADRLDRLDRRRASDPERHLRRQRRRARAARPLGRRRHLQVDRRRQDVDASRPARRPADSLHHRRPAQRRTGCSSPCSAIRTDRTRSAASIARPTAARRSRRCCRRTRTPARPISNSIRRIPTSSTPCLWEQRQGPWENGAWAGHQRRHLQVDRRRHDLASADARACRAEGVVQADIAVAPSDGNRIYATVANPQTVRHLSLRRCRRELDADHDRHSSGRPHRRRRSAGAGGRSEEPRHGDHRQHGQLSIEGRRQDLGRRCAARRAATTTSGRGSTRTTRTSSRWPAIRARSSASTAARRWSSWYNQPTAQMYHVNADNAFPYRVCGGQQESGSACVVEPRQRRA